MVTLCIVLDQGTYHIVVSCENTQYKKDNNSISENRNVHCVTFVCRIKIYY